MDKFDPKIHDDNPPLDAAFLSGMKPSRRERPKLETPKIEVKTANVVFIQGLDHDTQKQTPI